MKGKRLLSAILTLVMVLNIVFAIEAKAEASDSVDVETVTVREEAPNALAGNTARTSSYEEEPFAVKSMLYDSYSDPAYTTYEFVPNYWRIIPVTPEHTGCLWLDLSVYGSSSDLVNIYVVDSYKSNDNGIYNINYRMTENGDYTGWAAYGGQGSGYLYLPATKGETFWLLVETSSNNTRTMTVNLRARVFTTLQRNVSQGSKNWVTVSGINKSGNVNTTWFKVKPTKTGVMSVTLKEFGMNVSDGYVRLYNADKKAVSNTVTYSTADKVSRAYFGVKKNTTYYIKVSSCGGTESNYYKYGIKYSVSEKTDRALGSKSKAKSLTRKADATNTLFVATTSKSTDWYKIKVSEKRKTVVKVDASSIKSGNLYISVYKGDKLIGEKTLKANSTGEYTITGATAGTYYIKIVKGTKASGKYSIRYVK